MSKADDEFYRNFGAILAALFLFFLLALVIARHIGGNAVEAAQMAPREVAKRIQPVGQVNYGGAGEMAAPAAAPPAPTVVAASAKSGDAVYNAACFFCHSTGAAGSPRMGDKAAWEPRVGQGLAALLYNAINGKGGMPARGGNATLSDEDIEKAIKYILDETGVVAE